MVVWQVQTDDTFEASLRRAITESVLGGPQHGTSDDEDLVAQLRHYERQAVRERLSPQTRQVIASARRLLGYADRRSSPCSGLSDALGSAAACTCSHQGGLGASCYDSDAGHPTPSTAARSSSRRAAL